MRLTGGQIIAGISLLLSTLVAFLMTIATTNLPPWIQSHASLAWFLLLPSLLLLLLTTIKGAADYTTASLIDKDMLNRFMQVVGEAEDKTRHDPGLENITNGAGKLAEWKDVDRRLIRILGVDKKNDLQPHKSTEQLARLILRLTKAIIPAMSQRGQWNDLIEIARPAYTIGMALREWADAAFIAYELALTFNDQGRPVDSKMWIEQMDKGLKHITTHANSDELYSKLLDLKGVILRDYEGDSVKARKYFNEALFFAKKSRNHLMTWRVTTHLGTLEKWDKQLDKAIELYEKALDGAFLLNDPGLKLECYQSLGDLASLQRDFDKAHYWYNEQLNLATTSWRIIYKGRAHKGIAEALMQMSPPDVEQAYSHAREALRIEQEITGPKELELLILIVHITDRLWMKRQA